MEDIVNTLPKLLQELKVNQEKIEQIAVFHEANYKSNTDKIFNSTQQYMTNALMTLAIQIRQIAQHLISLLILEGSSIDELLNQVDSIKTRVRCAHQLKGLTGLNNFYANRPEMVAFMGEAETKIPDNEIQFPEETSERAKLFDFNKYFEIGTPLVTKKVELQEEGQSNFIRRSASTFKESDNPLPDLPMPVMDSSMPLALPDLGDLAMPPPPIGGLDVPPPPSMAVPGMSDAPPLPPAPAGGLDAPPPPPPPLDTGAPPPPPPANVGAAPPPPPPAAQSGEFDEDDDDIMKQIESLSNIAPPPGISAIPPPPPRL